MIQAQERKRKGSKISRLESSRKSGNKPPAKSRAATFSDNVNKVFLDMYLPPFLRGSQPDADK